MNPLWKSRENEIQSKEGAKPSFAVEGVPQLIQRILEVRGFSSKDQIDRLLFPKLADLKDPLSLKGMDIAVTRMVQAYKQDETICIYADFDLDGTSGLALLKTGLLGLGFKKVLHYQPKRLSQGYGFHIEAVEELKNQGVSLIVTVDVGITAVETVRRANELGVDIILTDHHLPGEELPPALTVVNPNQGTCPSGLGYLCGAGVAFYLLRALKRAFVLDPYLPKTDFDLKDVLEFFTIGTLTDMVPLWMITESL